MPLFFFGGDFMLRSYKKQIKRIFLLVIALITCFSLVTVTAFAEPYFENQFKFLNHKDLYSCVTYGTETWYVNNGGWFRAQDSTLNGDKYRFAQYNVGGFSENPGQIGGGNDNAVIVGFGIHSDGISVPAGGVLEVKFDWYYNITVDMTVVSNPNSTNPVLHTARQVPITGMKQGSPSGSYFRLKQVASNSVEKWFVVYPTIADYGLVSGDFYSGNAVYKSTIHLKFKNDTSADLYLWDCQFAYDPLKTFYNRNMTEWLSVNNGGIVPALNEITAIKPVKTTYSNWVSMGYGINDIPSYRVIQPDDVEEYELKEAIGDPSGNDFDDTEKRGEELRGDYDEIHKIEDDIASDFSGHLDDLLSEGGAFHPDSFEDYVENSNLKSSLLAVRSWFDIVLDEGFGADFFWYLSYAIMGGVFLAIVGQFGSSIASRIRNNRRGGDD